MRFLAVFVSHVEAPSLCPTFAGLWATAVGFERYAEGQRSNQHEGEKKKKRKKGRNSAEEYVQVWEVRVYVG